jgi:hypothetical protein
MTNDDAQSRVERAVAFIDEELPGVDRPDSAIAFSLLRRVRAILTAQDSSAGSPKKSDPDGTNVASGEPGGRSLPPPAEVKPSERIDKIAREWPRVLAPYDRQAEIEIKMHAIIRTLDEQHKRGRK